MKFFSVRETESERERKRDREKKEKEGTVSWNNLSSQRLKEIRGKIRRGGGSSKVWSEKNGRNIAFERFTGRLNSFLFWERSKASGYYVDIWLNTRGSSSTSVCWRRRMLIFREEYRGKGILFSIIFEAFEKLLNFSNPSLSSKFSSTRVSSTYRYTKRQNLDHESN